VARLFRWDLVALCLPLPPQEKKHFFYINIIGITPPKNCKKHWPGVFEEIFVVNVFGSMSFSFLCDKK
jgi:hypothetical protein